jgi:thiol-disulfide isomerase/thioredoxin
MAVAAIAFTLSPPQQKVSGSLVPAGRRVPMPDFTMVDLEGAPWTLAAHRGRVVLVNFWATWCPPCREEIPGFVRLAESEPDLEIAGIAMDDDGAADVRQFAKAAGVPYPILLPTVGEKATRVA